MKDTVKQIVLEITVNENLIIDRHSVTLRSADRPPLNFDTLTTQLEI